MLFTLNDPLAFDNRELSFVLTCREGSYHASNV